MAIRQDGAVVVAMPLQVTSPLLILDGSTGQTLSAPVIPPSSIQDTTGSTNSCDCLTPLGQPIVDSDGSVNVLYEVRDISEFDRGSGAPSIGSELSLLKIALDGTTSSTQVSLSDTANLFPGNLIPDGQGGILATWAAVPIDVTAPPLTNPYQAADVLSGLAKPFNMPMAPSQVITDPVSGLPSFFPLVLGENSTAFASYGTDVASFNTNVGSSNWNYQTTQGIANFVYTNGGGLTLIDGQSNQIPLDSGGNVGTSIALTSFSLLQPSLDGTWQGALAGLGIPLASINLTMNFGSSRWALQLGGPSPTHQAVDMPYLALLPNCLGVQQPCTLTQEALDNAFASLQTLISGNCTNCQTYVYNYTQLGLTKDIFSQYLMRPHHFYDATRSNAPAGEVLCIKHSVFNIFAEACPISPGNQKLPKYQFWQNLEQPGGITKTPSAQGEGLVTFWDPNQVNNAVGNSTGAIQNQAAIFHEALHGETGIFDKSPIAGSVRLESIFGFCFQPSQVITTYLLFNIFGVGANPPKCPQQ
jgi:hypothetical protein